VALIGNYRLGEELGRGPLGTVYVATNVVTHKEVVFRGFMKPPNANEVVWQECIQRYTEELSHAVELDHPNIAEIFEYGHSEGIYWIATELFTGQNVARLLDHDGPMGQEQAVSIVDQVGDALRHALEKGLLHLDLTPFNILLLEDQSVKVINFGLGHIRDKWGSPYASPEIVRNETPDARADVFSLGAVVYEMLAGDPPWVCSDADATMAAVLSEEPPELKQPKAVQDVVAKMMDKDPAGRYGDAGEAMQAFREAVHAGPTEAQKQEEETKKRTGLRAYRVKPGLSKFDLTTSDVRSAITELRSKLSAQRH